MKNSKGTDVQIYRYLTTYRCIDIPVGRAGTFDLETRCGARTLAIWGGACHVERIGVVFGKNVLEVFEVKRTDPPHTSYT